MKKIVFLLLISTSCISQVIKLNHKAYQIYFDVQLKEPIYTHYILTKDMLINSYIRSNFTTDDLVSKNNQGSALDYSNSGYDKGHLAPNDDFRSDDTTELESMLYTNCAPQNPNLNRGMWRTLEKYVAKIAEEYDVEVWTGCIYGNKKIGKLRVPTYFWKTIKYNNISESYRIPNSTPIKKEFKNYKVSKNELQ
jgi:endonuclease G, mitochondrial